MLFGVISPYIVAPLLAWLIAHTIKYCLARSKNQKYSLREVLFMSGGMPSGHSATIISVVTMIGLKDGITSGLFGLSLVVAIIIMYDALKVRRASGEQGVALLALIKEQKSKVKLPRVAKGHAPTEVAIGALLGFVVAILTFLIMN